MKRLIALLFALPLAVGAQTSPAPFSLGAARAIGGFTSLNVDDLNRRLAAAGLPRVASDAATVGLGSDVRIGSLILGGAWQSILSRTLDTPAYRSRISGSFALLDAGWIMARHAGMIVYPLAGIGAAGTSIAIDQRDDFTFDDGLAHPGRGLRVNGSTFLYQLGLGAEQQLKLGRPLAISMRVGMMRNIGAQGWSSEWETVRQGPRGYRGTYAQIAFATPLQSRREAAMPMAGAALRVAQR
jgi:hypothetical protein